MARWIRTAWAWGRRIVRGASLTGLPERRSKRPGWAGVLMKPGAFQPIFLEDGEGLESGSDWIVSFVQKNKPHPPIGSTDHEADAILWKLCKIRSNGWRREIKINYSSGWKIRPGLVGDFYLFIYLFFGRVARWRLGVGIKAQDLKGAADRPEASGRGGATQVHHTWRRWPGLPSHGRV